MGRPCGDNSRLANRSKGDTMSTPRLLSMSLAAVLALALTIDAGAARVVPQRSGKVVQKIGGIQAGGSAADLAAALVGPGVTVTNARFTGDPGAAGTFTGAAADISIASGVILSTGLVVEA